MPTVDDLAVALDAVAPRALAEPWDNVGLLLGDRSEELRGPVLLTIDLTPAVAREALDANAGAVIAYHPPIFKPIASLTADTPRGASLWSLASRGAAVLSPHTALDAAPGGLTDWLLDRCVADPETLGQRAALAPSAADGVDAVKLTVFVPAEHAAALREALHQAGAGVIGAYTRCTFSTAGVGTFRGDGTSNPAVGERERLETVDELRVETVCPRAKLPEAVAALRAAHPYEEPAFDIYPVDPAPEARTGAGRWASLGSGEHAGAIARRLGRALGVPAVKLATPDGAESWPVRRVAVCPGAGASLLDAACDRGCDLFVTGEMRHHEALAALDRGCAVALAGHTNTERGYLPVLADRLGVSGFACRVSAADRAPFSLVST